MVAYFCDSVFWRSLISFCAVVMASVGKTRLVSVKPTPSIAFFNSTNAGVNFAPICSCKLPAATSCAFNWPLTVPNSAAAEPSSLARFSTNWLKLPTELPVSSKAAPADLSPLVWPSIAFSAMSVAEVRSIRWAEASSKINGVSFSICLAVNPYCACAAWIPCMSSASKICKVSCNSSDCFIKRSNAPPSLVMLSSVNLSFSVFACESVNALIEASANWMILLIVKAAPIPFATFEKTLAAEPAAVDVSLRVLFSLVVSRLTVPAALAASK